MALIYYLYFQDIDGSIQAHFTHNPLALILLSLFNLLPLRFLAQRYKDAGISGWWALVGIVPTAYGLLYLLMGLFPGEKHNNQHGEQPKKPNTFLVITAYMPMIVFAGLMIWYFLIKQGSNIA